MKIASAPISFGVFGEIDVSGTMTVDELLQNISSIGFTGCEYGPPGFFGSPEIAKRAFCSHQLTPVGAYIPLHTQDHGAILSKDLERMRTTFDELEQTDGPRLAIFADEGDPNLLLNPRKDRSLCLDGKQWDRLIEVVSASAEEARQRGLVPTFHPHISTFVELPDEIERFLNDTSIPLTFDVGHIVLAGGDGCELFKRWQERINHIHIKDVKRQVLEAARLQRRPDFDQWWAEVSVRLGDGDCDLETFVKVLADSKYNGWLVIEHDCAPISPQTRDQILQDQQASFQWLTETLLKSTKSQQPKDA